MHACSHYYDILIWCVEYRGEAEAILAWSVSAADLFSPNILVRNTMSLSTNVLHVTFSKDSRDVQVDLPVGNILIYLPGAQEKLEFLFQLTQVPCPHVNKFIPTLAFKYLSPNLTIFPWCNLAMGRAKLIIAVACHINKHSPNSQKENMLSLLPV